LGGGVRGGGGAVLRWEKKKGAPRSGDSGNWEEHPQNRKGENAENSVLHQTEGGIGEKGDKMRQR